MIAGGLIEEVKALLDRGYSLDLPSMSSIGYKQIGLFILGKAEKEEAIRRLKTANHRFVRHQYAWFRLADKRIHWFDVKGGFEPPVFDLISNLLS